MIIIIVIVEQPYNFLLDIEPGESVYNKHNPSTGQHRRRHRWYPHAPARQGALVSCLPAAGRSFPWRIERHGSSKRPASAPPPVLLRDTRRRAAAPGLGDGQNPVRPEILPKVSC